MPQPKIQVQSVGIWTAMRHAVIGFVQDWPEPIGGITENTLGALTEFAAEPNTWARHVVSGEQLRSLFYGSLTSSWRC